MADKKILQEDGENIMPLTHETCVLNDDGTSIAETIGDLSLLNTDSVVSAINVLFDSTLKEQIVGILVNNGEEVSIDNDWITIVNKLRESTSGGSGGLDIISVTALPATGKENQLCVVMKTPVENYVITSEKTYTEQNKVILYNGAGTPNYSVALDNQQLFYSFYKASYNKANYALYKWDDSWIQLTYSFVHLLEEGKNPGNELGTSIITSSTVAYMTDSLDGLGYIRFPSTSSYKHITTTDTMIDFGKYSRVEITARMISGSSGKSIAIGKSNSKQAGIATTSSISTYFTQYTSGQNLTSTWTVYTYDISTWSGEAYLGLWCTSASNQAGFRDIKLYP